MRDDPDGLVALADEVESAARVLLNLSTRAGMQLPGSVSLTQLRALAAVEELGSCTLGALADALMISISTASRLVDRISELNLLDRRQSPTNRRELTIRVTPRGKRMLRRHEAARRAVFEEALVDVPVADAEALLRGLRAVERQQEKRVAPR
jgi:DNA-binding MarR family transcriptional regulator